MAKPIKPGTDNQKPGTYVEVGPRGGNVTHPRIVHIDPGDRLPPTQEPGRGWQKKWIWVLPTERGESPRSIFHLNDEPRSPQNDAKSIKLNSQKYYFMKTKPPETWSFRWFLVRPAGFEPVAYRVGVCHSIQLSYGRIYGFTVRAPKIVFLK